MGTVRLQKGMASGIQRGLVLLDLLCALGQVAAFSESR